MQGTSMQRLKQRFLSSHYGYFFASNGDTLEPPINSKGSIDWDTFLILIINQGIELIDYYTIYDMVQHVPVEMKSVYAKRIAAIEKKLPKYLVKPKYPKLMMPQDSSIPVEVRLKEAIDYYNKCEDNIRDCNKVIIDAIDKLIADEESADPGQKLLDRVRAQIPMELTNEEIEAVIMHVKEITHEGITFRKNMLLALKVLNRFAREQEIRVEDAIAVIKDLL
jgi:hypothetical protein